MKRLFLAGLAVPFALAVSATARASSPATPKLYGLTFFSRELITVDAASGAATVLGPLSAPVSGYGLAARYGRLYSFDPATDRIIEISTADGRATRSLDLGLGNLQGEGDLAFRGDGTGFLFTALAADGSPTNELFSFDVIAGTSQKIGGTGITLDALAFDRTGRLFALGQGEGKLYRVDTATAVVTEVGNLGVAQNSPFAALAFGPDGTLYAGVDDRLYRVNPATGAATPVQADTLDFGFSSVAGLAFQTPEPGGQLYGLAFFAGQLLQVDPATGGGSALSAPGTSPSGFGLAARAGRLYTFGQGTNRIVELDPGSGLPAASFGVGLPALQGEGDLAFRADGVGFLAAAFETNGTPVNGLYRFDLATGTSVRVGTSGVTLDGLAFLPDGTLYALGQGEGKLYRVNPDTAAVTVVGELGVAQNSPFAALAAGPGGVLYASVDDRLYAVNAVTGAATPVSPDVLDFGHSSVAGLAFAAAAARLGIEEDGAAPALHWSGEGYTLEAAGEVNGPYTAAASQANPQRINPPAAQRFYRLRR